LLLAAAGVEAVVIFLLIAAPVAGLAATAALVLIYAIELRRLGVDEDCECFGAALRARTRSGAIARNLTIAATSAACAAGYATDVIAPRPLSGTVLGLALITGALVASPPLLRRVSPSGSRRHIATQSTREESWS
jgi:hypothetical protein